MSKESQSLCFLRVATPTQNQKNYNIHFKRLFEHPHHMGISYAAYGTQIIRKTTKIVRFRGGLSKLYQRGSFENFSIFY